MRSQDEYELVDRLVRLGMSTTEIAKLTGIPRNTIKAWRKFGRTRLRGPNRSQAEYDEAMRLIAWGMNNCEISRLTGIPHGTIRYWRTEGRKGYKGGPGAPTPCPICDGRELDHRSYAYLLGLYLGDGCLVHTHRGVYRMSVACDPKYPNIIKGCAAAMQSVKGLGSRIALVSSHGCISVESHWKHWVCLFPQHGAGPKHARTIELVGWQQEIVNVHPRPFLRGLIYSDGSRDLNVVNGKSYPRHQFSNFSPDIQQIFCATCEQLGVHWTQPYWNKISISRRADVAKLDEFIGPKC